MNTQLESIQSDHLATITGGIDFRQAHQAGDATAKTVNDAIPQALRWNPVTGVPAFGAMVSGYVVGAGGNVIQQLTKR